MLLDEPCSALDPISTAAIEELIIELRESVAIVIVTHNLQQAFRVADHVAFMHLGELVEYGPSDQVFNRPTRAAHARLRQRGVWVRRGRRPRCAALRGARAPRLRIQPGKEREARKVARRAARSCRARAGSRRRTRTARSRHPGKKVAVARVTLLHGAEGARERRHAPEPHRHRAARSPGQGRRAATPAAISSTRTPRRASRRRSSPPR